MLINPYIFAGGAPAGATAFFSDIMLSSGWEPVSGPSGFYDSSTDRTYVAWQFVGRSGYKGVHVAYFDHSTGLWSARYRVGNFHLVNDDHGHPAIVRDADGYLHCFFGSHRNGQKYSISTNPDDPSSWTQQADIGTRHTYPKVVLVGSTLYLFMRDSSTSGNWKLALRTATPAGGSASFSSGTILVDFGADSRVYQAEAHVVGTDIHFVCAFADSADTERKGVYYFVYKTATGAIESFDGTTSVASGSLPISKATADSSFRIYDHGSNDGDLASLQFDSNGVAHVLFADGSSSPFDLKHMYLSGGSWSSPATVAQIQDRSAFGGYVNTYCLVPGPSGSMQAWYNDNGNMTRKVLSSVGGAWGSAQTMAAKGSYDFVQVAAIRDADAELRTVFAENLGALTDSSAVPLGLYAHGDNGHLTVAIDTSGGDANWADVRLLLGMESRDGATRVIDESPSSFRMVSAAGQAQIDTAQKKFGNASLRLDGSGDYITFPHDGAYSVAPAAGDFTIEAWIRLNATGALKMIAGKRPNSGTQDWSFGILETNVLFFQMFNSSSGICLNISGTTAMTTGTWYHVAACREGTTTRIFVDGNLEASGTQSDNPTAANQPLFIGRDNGPLGSGRDFNGWIDEFRFTRFARYTASFTPPTAAFPRY